MNPIFRKVYAPPRFREVLPNVQIHAKSKLINETSGNWLEMSQEISPPDIRGWPIR
jgi:hypothetical protein